jgi:hypothetical protein
MLDKEIEVSDNGNSEVDGKSMRISRTLAL